MGESGDFPEPREAKADRRGNVTSAGLDPDDWDRLEQWRTERRLSRSEATRRIIRRGLDTTDSTRQAVSLASGVAGAAYIAAYVFAGTTAAGLVGGAYIVVTLLWSAWLHMNEDETPEIDE